MLRLKYIYISLKNTKTIDGFKWKLVACYFICPNFAQQLYFLSWFINAGNSNTCLQIYCCSAKFCRRNWVISIGKHTNGNFASGQKISPWGKNAAPCWPTEGCLVWKWLLFCVSCASSTVDNGKMTFANVTAPLQQFLVINVFIFSVWRVLLN